jgi:dipeptidyl aminopeptidase/acylaminoacyl peptidase
MNRTLSKAAGWLTVALGISGLVQAADAERWTAELELGDAPLILIIELPADGTDDVEPEAVLTNELTSGSQPVAVDSWQVTGTEVTFRLTGLGRPYAFNGVLADGMIVGTLERRPHPVPATDLYLLPVESGWRFGPPVRVTDREGYDNQPYFLPDGRTVLYTSMRDGQTDIYRYDVVSGTTTRLTATEDSEYSPTPLPDGSGFSCIRQTTEGKQYLWAYDAEGTPREQLFDRIEPVGYHAWLDDGTLALFVLGEPMTLQVADLVTGEATLRDERIGRALHRSPGSSDVTYVRKDGDLWTIRRLPPAGSESEILIEALPGREDFVWTPDGRLLMGSGSELYLAEPGGKWKRIAALADQGIGGITRLALSPDGRRLVVVGERPDMSPLPERIDLTLRREE